MTLYWYTGILMHGIEKRSQSLSHGDSCGDVYLAHSLYIWYYTSYYINHIWKFSSYLRNMLATRACWNTGLISRQK